MADARPCDALRRYMQRAETRATTRQAVAQATHAPRSRWGARPEQPRCAEGSHGTRALRLYALTRFSIDETQPSRVYQRLLEHVREQVAALASVPVTITTLRATDALPACSSADAGRFAAMFHGVCESVNKSVSEVHVSDGSCQEGRRWYLCDE